MNGPDVRCDVPCTGWTEPERGNHPGIVVPASFVVRLYFRSTEFKGPKAQAPAPWQCY